MAMNLAPSHWLPGFELLSANGTATAQSIAIPLTALPGLSAAEANASTGDFRKVARAICAALHKAWIDEPEADRPSQMEFSRSTSVNEDTDRTTRLYQGRFVVAVREEEVVDEPSAES